MSPERLTAMGIEEKNARDTDLEKSRHAAVAPSLPIQDRRSLLTVIIVMQLILAVIVFLNREVMDNLHQMLNSVLLSIICSGTAQSTIQFFRPVNYNKILKFWVWGAINGIISPYWIDLLLLKTDGVVERVLYDQFIGSPFFQLLFVVYNCIWEDLSILPGLRQIYFKTLGLSYMIFPISSFISFGFLPQHLIFPFNCLTSLVWTVILSLVTG